MKDGFTLDYVYHQDGMGGYPIPLRSPRRPGPLPGRSRLPTAGEHPDYLGCIEPRDTSEDFSSMPSSP